MFPSASAHDRAPAPCLSTAPVDGRAAARAARCDAVRQERLGTPAEKRDPIPDSDDPEVLHAWMTSAATGGQRVGRFTRVARWVAPLDARLLPVIAPYHNGVLNWLRNVTSIDCAETEALLHDLLTVWLGQMAPLTYAIPRDVALADECFVLAATRGHLAMFPAVLAALRTAVLSPSAAHTQLSVDARQQAIRTLLHCEALTESDLQAALTIVLAEGIDASAFDRVVFRRIVDHPAVTEAILQHLAHTLAPDRLPMGLTTQLATRRVAIRASGVRAALVATFVHGWADPDAAHPVMSVHHADAVGRIFLRLWRATPASEPGQLAALMTTAIARSPVQATAILAHRTNSKVRRLPTAVLNGAFLSPNTPLREAALLAVGRLTPRRAESGLG
jgi:hypothetical protein